MAIVGFNFSKIRSEKKKISGALRVANNITLKDVEDAKLNFVDAKQKSLLYWFTFSSKYETDADKDAGMIELEGNVVSMVSAEEAKATLDQWKKDKKLADAELEKILNYALDRCNVEAILMSREIGLPAPLQLPRLTTAKKA